MRLCYCAQICGNVQWHLQLQFSVQLFDVAFSIKKFSFCGAFFKHILAWKRDISKKWFLEWNCSSPYSLVFHLPYSEYKDVKMFLLMLLSKSKIFTHVALVSLVKHLCHYCCTRVALMSLISHSCCSCLALVL